MCLPPLQLLPLIRWLLPESLLKEGTSSVRSHFSLNCTLDFLYRVPIYLCPSCFQLPFLHIVFQHYNVSSFKARTLSFHSYLYSHCLAQCLEHNKCLISAYWLTESNITRSQERKEFQGSRFSVTSM